MEFYPELSYTMKLLILFVVAILQCFALRNMLLAVPI